jgi:hypothetical protein
VRHITVDRSLQYSCRILGSHSGDYKEYLQDVTPYSLAEV